MPCSSGCGTRPARRVYAVLSIAHSPPCVLSLIRCIRLFSRVTTMAFVLFCLFGCSVRMALVVAPPPPTQTRLLEIFAQWKLRAGRLVSRIPSALPPLPLVFPTNATHTIKQLRAHICVCACVYVYIYVLMQSENEWDEQTAKERGKRVMCGRGALWVPSAQ